MCVYLGVLTDCIQRSPEVTIDWDVSWRLKEVDEVAWATTRQKLRDAYNGAFAVMKDLRTWKAEDDIGASLVTLAYTASHLGAIRQTMNSAGMQADSI